MINGYIGYGVTKTIEQQIMFDNKIDEFRLPSYIVLLYSRWPKSKDGDLKSKNNKIVIINIFYLNL